LGWELVEKAGGYKKFVDSAGNFHYHDGKHFAKQQGWAATVKGHDVEVVEDETKQNPEKLYKKRVHPKLDGLKSNEYLRLYLKNEAGEEFYIKVSERTSRKEVLEKFVKLRLDYAPEGWDNIEIKKDKVSQWRARGFGKSYPQKITSF